jgi:hypothetical protein
VKAALLVLPVYAVLFIAIFSLFTALSTVYYWIGASHAVNELGASVLLPHIVDALPSIVVASTVISLFFLLLTQRRRSRIGLPAALSAFFFSFFLYAGLFILSSEMQSNEEGPPISSPYRAGYLYPLSEYLFYGETIRYSDADLPVFGPVALISPNNREAEEKQVLSLYRSGTFYFTQGELILEDPEGGRDAIPLGEDASGPVSSLETPVSVRRIGEEIGMITRSLTGLRENSFLLFIGAMALHILFIISGWSFIRTSSWPLFNALLGLLLMRVFFLLHRLSIGDAVEAMLFAVSMEKYLPLLPSIILLTASFLFLFWGIAFHLGSKEGGR